MIKKIKSLIVAVFMPKHLRWAHALKPGDFYEDVNFNKCQLVRKEYNYRIPVFLDNFLYRALNLYHYIEMRNKASRWFSFSCYDIYLFGISNNTKNESISFSYNGCCSVAGGDANPWDEQQNKINIEEYDRALRS
jgi:hypothetical protein